MDTITPERLTTAAEQKLVITPPNMQYARIGIIGTTPYMQHKFSEKSRIMMEERQRQGELAKKVRKRTARQFEEDYKAATHFAREGWVGIPASAFRDAMISACRVAGFTMTRAKLSLFVYPVDGYDATEGTPLIRIEGDMSANKDFVRNESGVVDIRWRPMFAAGWTAVVPVEWDGDQFSGADVLHLVERAGEQVGIGEGRADSPKSNGKGYGHFQVAVGEEKNR